MKIVNVIKQTFKNTANFRVILGKIGKRIFENKNTISTTDNLNWIKSNLSNYEELVLSLDANLWKETQQISEKLTENANKILENLPYQLGGGGFYPFLYFITRYTKPNNIVETGVAAGFSSYAFLKAIDFNQKGHLYSSDFPYFRLPSPEKYIGIVVEESLKKYWHLYIEGDEINLEKIVNKIDHIDIFHYDSDKSYSGRKMAMSLIEQKLKANSIILMDDIKDNCFFYDYIQQNSPGDWSIFEYEGKYIGMIGKINKF